MLFCDILRNKTIFIAPLDWGLGHATRCVPLIKQLVEYNVVILGVTATTSLIFDEEFPHLQKVEIEPYKIHYSNNTSLCLTLLLDSFRIFKVIKKEKKQLSEIITKYKIDTVISDNRFGLYNENVDCIYITHQLNIRAGLFSFCANKIHHRYIKKFNLVLVPDFADDKDYLAGHLSRNKEFRNVTYIGPLSRLPFPGEAEKEYDFLCLLSGPEPLRTQLESQLVEKARETNKKICIVRGTSSKNMYPLAENLTFIDLPSAKDLSRLIQSSKTIISRSGYSTLMDLHHLKKRSVILIPTLGQYEQLYLAAYWNSKFRMQVLFQKDLPDFKF